MQRAFHVLVLLFWLLMNGMLIRSEMGNAALAGITVPPELIWRKLVQASDQSLLALTHRGYTNRIGSFRWMPTTLEHAQLRAGEPDAARIEGMGGEISGYTLDLDGNMLLPLDPAMSHLRISMLLRIDTNTAWTDLHLQLGIKPMTWTFTASASAKEPSVQVKTEGPEGTQQRTFTASDLRHPERWMGELGGGMLPGLLTAIPDANHYAAFSAL